MTTPYRCPEVEQDLLGHLASTIDCQPWARRSIEALEAVHRRHVSCAPVEPPEGETEWYHLYVCPVSGVRLAFDPCSPHAHRSPATGQVLTGEPYDGSWRGVMQGVWVAALERAALLCRAGRGGSDLRRWMRDLLMHWAGTWESHGVKPRGGQGRLMPQGLTEAIFQASVCQSLQWVPDLLDAEDWSTLRDGMLAPAAEFLRPQWSGGDSSGSDWGGDIHNIACWLNAAKYGLGWALQDDELKKLAVDGPVGWFAQVGRGIDDDGWWYEKTLTYQGYTLRALLTLAMLARSDGLDLLGEKKLGAMGSAMLRVVRDDGSLPAWNDGWRDPPLSNMLDQLEVLAGAGHEEIAARLAWLQTKFPCSRRGLAWVALPGGDTWVDGVQPVRAGVAALAWGADELPDPVEPERTVVFFPDSGICVLHGGAVRLSVRSGPHGGGHDHRDRTDLTVRLRGEPIAEDMGTPAYGSELAGTWYRQAASHRLVMVERRSQMPSDGRIVEADGNRVVAEAAEAYVNAGLRREVRLDEDGRGWQDRVSVSSDDGLLLDWIFHLRGEVCCPDQLQPEATPTDWRGGGIEHIIDLHSLPLRTRDDRSSVRVRWQTAAGKLELAVEVEHLSEPVARLGSCPDNPADRTLSAIVLSGRSTESDAVFTAHWRLIEEQAGQVS